MIEVGPGESFVNGNQNWATERGTQNRSSSLALVFRRPKTHLCLTNVILCEPLLPFIRLQSIPQSDFAGLPHVAGSIPEQETTEMANGTVRFFNSSKGFGFIETESGGKDVFVHISAVERAGLTGLADAQKVTFEVETGRDGRESATNLALA